MTRALLILDGMEIRAKALDWIRRSPDGTRVEFKTAKRTLPQNDRMWAMLTEIASQCRHHDIKLTPDDWKKLFMDQLDREMRLVPNLEGTGFVAMNNSSSDLSKQEMSDMIELIFAYGAKHNVQFKEPSASRKDCYACATQRYSCEHD